jgi:hypothetical protein
MRRNQPANFKANLVAKALSDKVVEHCVVCWTKTRVERDTPIEFRDYFVEGVGQLCSRCFRALNDHS